MPEESTNLKDLLKATTPLQVDKHAQRTDSQVNNIPPYTKEDQESLHDLRGTTAAPTHKKGENPPGDIR